MYFTKDRLALRITNVLYKAHFFIHKKSECWNNAQNDNDGDASLDLIIQQKLGFRRLWVSKISKTPQGDIQKHPISVSYTVLDSVNSSEKALLVPGVLLVMNCLGYGLCKSLVQANLFVLSILYSQPTLLPLLRFSNSKHKCESL